MAQTCNLTSWEDDVALTSCGRERLGLDSVQFTHHNEQIFKYEILSTQIYRGMQTNGCPDKQHAGLLSKVYCRACAIRSKLRSTAMADG